MKYDRNTVKEWAEDSQWRAIRADLARFRMHGYSGWGSEGLWALAIFRLQKTCQRARPRWMWTPARMVLALLRKVFTLVTHIGIDHDAEIGPGMLIPHCGSLRIHSDTKIGADCCINHVCTIGASGRPGGAVIGDHVWIGCHSSIIGRVVVGDNAVIASNSLVIIDVPAGATAMGVPARILPGGMRPGVDQLLNTAHEPKVSPTRG